MLILERVAEAGGTIERLPLLVVVGVLVIGAGAGLDVLVHRAPAHEDAHAGFHPQEHIAHFTVVVGMLLTWAGVVLDGVRRQARRPTRGRDSDAG